MKQNQFEELFNYLFIKGDLMPPELHGTGLYYIEQAKKSKKKLYYKKNEVGSDPIEPEILPFKIPDTWCWSRLGEMVSLRRARVPHELYVTLEDPVGIVDYGFFNRPFGLVCSIENCFDDFFISAVLKSSYAQHYFRERLSIHSNKMLKIEDVADLIIPIPYPLPRSIRYAYNITYFEFCMYMTEKNIERLDKEGKEYLKKVFREEFLKRTIIE